MLDILVAVLFCLMVIVLMKLARRDEPEAKETQSQPALSCDSGEIRRLRLSAHSEIVAASNRIAQLRRSYGSCVQDDLAHALRLESAARQDYHDGHYEKAIELGDASAYHASKTERLMREARGN